MRWRPWVWLLVQNTYYIPYVIHVLHYHKPFPPSFSVLRWACPHSYLRLRRFLYTRRSSLVRIPDPITDHISPLGEMRGRCRLWILVWLACIRWCPAETGAGLPPHPRRPSSARGCQTFRSIRTRSNFVLSAWHIICWVGLHVLMWFLLYAVIGAPKCGTSVWPYPAVEDLLLPLLAWALCGDATIAGLGSVFPNKAI